MVTFSPFLAVSDRHLQCKLAKGLRLGSSRTIKRVAAYDALAARGTASAPSMLRPAWIILGPPGSGKGTYAGLLAPMLRLDHFSTGDLARQAMQEPGNAALKRQLDSGGLLPQGVILKLLQERLRAVPPSASAALIDGFPRTLDQAKMLDTLCSVSIAVQIILKDEHILAKIDGRLACQSCKRGFNTVLVHDEQDQVFMPPILPKNMVSPAAAISSGSGTQVNLFPGQNLFCDCGAQLERRPDDAVGIAKARLERHHAETGAVLDHYARQGKLLQHFVQYGVQDMDTLAERIRRHLEGP
eukprot:TRINITY_DN28117_c0_g1_i1.p1 TRINITY_DN28117_c0_g1~~TRINITY_DN28117_c0_g1_i1.p1  ORF type:complete len:299 (-),score=43.74 TRINITY_DN28117_c0_g1_i1:121-1017(-)